MGDKIYKIIAASDSHGNTAALRALIPLLTGCDAFVYLGDGNRDIDRAGEFPVPVIRVAGNCDLGCSFALETTFSFGQTKFLATHGHMYAVKSGLTLLAAHAAGRDCGVALYGHTHRADVRIAGGVTLVNPGTLSGRKPTYAVLTGDDISFGAEIFSL